ncbi:MAG: hypothetical protein CVV57_09255 [Tenericutes bacterium HGW-Tenericutes-2]|jgi:hypothetical protein|nr:MAG: hypothetical protein CVV57_09255 [Tenericutes bacterium HGW-Tenericutes-2]
MRKLNIFIYITSILTLIVSLILPNNKDGYEWLPILPLIFILCNILFFQNMVLKKKSIVATIFWVSSFLRYVLLVFFLSVSDDKYIGQLLTPDSNLIVKSILLMGYELFVSSFLLAFFVEYFSKRRMKSEQKIPYPTFLHGKIVYYIIILIALLIFVIYKDSRLFINFFILNSSSDRVDESLSTVELLTRQIFISAITFSFLIVIDRSRKLYNKYGRTTYIAIALTASALILSVIIGERRSTQIYTMFAVMSLLLMLFPKQKIKILLVTGIVGGGVLLGMTVYKHAYVFLYSSYFDAIESIAFDIKNIASTMQIYLLGPFNVAHGLGISDVSSQPIGRLFYDFGRSIIGLNFLLKDLMLTTSEIFNLRLYGSNVQSGHLLPITAHGYIYMGFILSPLLSVLFLIFGLIIENLYRKTYSIELKYIYSYILIRLSSPIIIGNLASILNAVSLTLMSLGLVYLLNKTIGKIIVKKS